MAKLFFIKRVQQIGGIRFVETEKKNERKFSMKHRKRHRIEQIFQLNYFGISQHS